MFSPPPGTYAETQYVSIIIPEADQIFYTLDGTTPHENCLEYTGTPIEISTVTIIKVIYFVGGVPSEVVEGAYNIGDGSSGDSSTNRQLLLDWIDHEYLLSALLKFHNNCGQEPNGGGCDDGDQES